MDRYCKQVAESSPTDGGFLWKSVSLAKHLRCMGMTRFQRLATAALVSLMALICVGAVVRVSGAGLGCPDWPRCWGKLVPPSSADEIDFDKLPMEKFRRAAEKHGLDRETVTAESLHAEFNVTHAWTEYLNRLSATPVSIFTIATFVAAFWQRKRRPLVFWMAFASLMLVIVNALVGAMVVSSRLKPVIITIHLALAMVMLATLTYCAWRGTDTPWRIRLKERGGLVKCSVAILVLAVAAEGMIGSQIREITDEMAKAHVGQARDLWIDELEQAGVYLFHRSFSWAVLAASIWAYWMSGRFREGGAGRVEKAVMGIVLIQMILGMVMSQVHIYQWVQVVHVGLAAVLLSLVILWWLGLMGRGRDKASGV
jgi:cytochrome c oxidase assembly protein subunit 15